MCWVLITWVLTVQISPVLSSGHPSCQRWTTPTGPKIKLSARHAGLTSVCLSVCFNCVSARLRRRGSHPPPLPKKKYQLLSALIAPGLCWTDYLHIKHPRACCREPTCNTQTEKKKGAFPPRGKKKNIETKQGSEKSYNGGGRNCVELRLLINTAGLYSVTINLAGPGHKAHTNTHKQGRRRQVV